MFDRIKALWRFTIVYNVDKWGTKTLVSVLWWLPRSSSICIVRNRVARVLIPKVVRRHAAVRLDPFNFDVFEQEGI